MYHGIYMVLRCTSKKKYFGFLIQRHSKINYILPRLSFQFESNVITEKDFLS